MKKIVFIDLFAGIGGFHISFKKITKLKNLETKCSFVSEIDNRAKQVYAENFGTKVNDIINIKDIGEKAELVPNHDFLFAGFPCQTFSNAGKKRGFLDEIRGTLFFDIVKILKFKSPNFFLLENVKHLVNHDNGKTWKIIKEHLIKLGYIIPKTPIIISPHEFGIPQNRERVFIPGVNIKYLQQKNIRTSPEIFNNFKDNIKNVKNKMNYSWENFLEKTVLDKYYITDDYFLNVLNGWKEFVNNVKMIKNRTLPVIWVYDMIRNINQEEIDTYPNWRKKYIKDMKEIYRINKNFIDLWISKYNVLHWKKRDQKLEWHAGIHQKNIENTWIQLRQSGIRCRKKGIFPTLVALVQIPIIFDKLSNKWRKLTPREVSNLQCFPKNFKIYSDISNEQNADFWAYKQFGNSINVDVVSYIINEILVNFWDGYDDK